MKRSLRIALSCQQDVELHSLPAYRFWAHYFRQGLAEAGHTVLECRDCDWAKGLLPLSSHERQSWLTATWTKHEEWLRREHSRGPVDLFLSYLFPLQILPDAVRSIRELGIPCVNFFCDNVREFRNLPQEFAPFDLHWVPEHKASALYARAGLPFVHAPMPCWVPPQWRTFSTEDLFPTTFIGTKDPLREELFSAAIRQGLGVDLRGVGWHSPDGALDGPTAPRPSHNPITRVRQQIAFADKHGWSALIRKVTSSLRTRPVDPFDFSTYSREMPHGDEYWGILRGSRVCLGVNRYPSFRHPIAFPDTYSRLRDLEAPMVGACYLTEWTTGLDQLYDIGVEIETYRDATELAEKTRDLLADAPRRRSLRQRGQQRALREHTIGRSIERIADRLGIANKRRASMLQ